MKYVNTGIVITSENQGTTLLLVDQTNSTTCQSVLMQKNQLQVVGRDQFQDMFQYCHDYQEEYLYQEYFQTKASLGQFGNPNNTPIPEKTGTCTKTKLYPVNIQNNMANKEEK